MNALGRSPLQASILLLAAAVLPVAGCSRGPGYPYATVSGQVTIDGRPVPKGSITFSPTAPGQGAVTGGPIVDGQYRCEKVPLGKHRVTFIAQAAEMDTIVDVTNGQKHEVPKNILPSQYLTGLETEVKTDQAPHDFPLVSKAGRSGPSNR